MLDNLSFCCRRPRASLAAVSDIANNRVQVFDRDGSFQFAFGSAGSNEGEFANPAGGLAEALSPTEKQAQTKPSVTRAKAAFIRTP